VRNAELAQVLAHRHAGLPGADDEGVYLLNGLAERARGSALVQVGHHVPALSGSWLLRRSDAAGGSGLILFSAGDSRNYVFCSR